MNKTTRRLAVTYFALAIGGTAGCSDVPTAPPVERHETQGQVVAPGIELSGTWNWSSTELIRMPPGVAAMVGIAPEGPNTHARCESSGSMDLTQAGKSFQGTAFRTSNACLTKGGQTFEQPSTVLSVADGQISGIHVAFSFESFIIRPCPHRAVVGMNGGVAVSIRGTGRCILPGHPQSESPIPSSPPPGGTSVTLEWEAHRP